MTGRAYAGMMLMMVLGVIGTIATEGVSSVIYSATTLIIGAIYFSTFKQ